jgi:hypothetical protein
MGAFDDLELKLFGDEETLRGMLEIVGLYANEEDKPAYFTDVEVNGDEIDFANIPDAVTAGGSVVVTASGPYGRYDELNEIPIFRDLAEAFPKGRFTAELSIDEKYTEESLECELRDGKLHIETLYVVNEEPYEAWIKDFMKGLPLDEFKTLFKVKGEDFDEESYRDVIESMGLGSECYVSLSYMNFADFVRRLKNNDAKTELEEEEFTEIIKRKLPELDIISLNDFEHECFDTSRIHLIYDPVAKAYVK